MRPRTSKKAEARRTALVEMDRANVFTLSLGNVQPADVIVIRFAYVEELEAWKDGLSLQIPFTRGVRYIPGQPLLRSNSGKGTVDDTDQVPDASRISPPRIDRMHPDAATLFLSGRMDGRDVDLESIFSPTHPTAVRPAGTDLQIFLPNDAALPDRDFVLRWRRAERSDLLPIAFLFSDKRFSKQRRSHIVLITDGQVGNEHAVLEAMAGYELPVHSFGIDHSVNEAFLRQLSNQQRGTSVFLTPNDDLVRPVAILGSKFSKPVFMGLSLAENWELADAKLPDIYAGQVIFAPLRANGTFSAITVIGKDGQGRPLTVRLQNQPAQTDLPRLL